MGLFEGEIKYFYKTILQGSQWNSPPFCFLPPDFIPHLKGLDTVLPRHSMNTTGSPFARGGAAANPGFRETLMPCFLSSCCGPSLSAAGPGCARVLAGDRGSWSHGLGPKQSSAKISSGLLQVRNYLSPKAQRSPAARPGGSRCPAPDQRRGRWTGPGGRRRMRMMKALRAAGSGSCGRSQLFPSLSCPQHPGSSRAA